MALCNHSRKEVEFKIVYCGTPLGGKTTSLQYIHRKLDPHFRSELTSQQPTKDRDFRCDFLTVNAMRLEGFRTRLQLYAIPGKQKFAGNREIVLRGADGVIFVADSTRDRMEDNLESLQSTRQVLELNGLDPDTIPFVFQYNKRDLPGAVPPEEMDEILGATGPAVMTCAVSGYQVVATLDQVTEFVLKNFRSSAVRGREQNSEENVASPSDIALSR